MEPAYSIDKYGTAGEKYMYDKLLKYQENAMQLEKEIVVLKTENCLLQRQLDAKEELRVASALKVQEDWRIEREQEILDAMLASEAIWTTEATKVCYDN